MFGLEKVFKIKMADAIKGDLTKRLGRQRLTSV